MADIFSVTAPLMIRLPSGEQQVVAELFPHPQGILFFELYWHLGLVETSMHIARGQVKGEGPWKVGDHVFNVLGCHGSNAELATAYQQWSEYLAANQSSYPPAQLIQAIARKMGADV